MARLPDPTSTLDGDDLAAYRHMAAARAASDKRAALANVYVNMFNNPGVAEKVGALGEQIRFQGVLPAEARECAVLRFAVRRRYGYEWSHHQHTARLAGLTDEEIEALTSGRIPESLPTATKAVLQAVDAVLAGQSIPEDVQETVVDAYGASGIVELVVLCGLYTIMGFMITSFDIPLEPGMPQPPF